LGRLTGLNTKNCTLGVFQSLLGHLINSLQLNELELKDKDATEICEKMAVELQNFMSVHLGGEAEN